MSNRGSIYNLAKYHRINQQDLNLLFQKMLFEGDLRLKVCVRISWQAPSLSSFSPDRPTLSKSISLHKLP